MDTSETYIKMADCPEIQEQLDKSEHGNYIHRRFIANTPNAALREYTCTDITPSLYWLKEYGNGQPANQWVSDYWQSDSPDYYGTDVVWLPRQDQLQEMVIETVCERQAKVGDSRLMWLCRVFHDSLLTPHELWSMEQLWLAFVMKEKHGKTWDGQAWAPRQTA